MHSRTSTWQHPQLSNSVSYEMLRFNILPSQAMKAQSASRCTVPLGLNLLLDRDGSPTSRSDPWTFRPERNQIPIRMEAWLAPESVWLYWEMRKTPLKGSRPPARSGRSLENTPTSLHWNLLFTKWKKWNMQNLLVLSIPTQNITWNDCSWNLYADES